MHKVLVALAALGFAAADKPCISDNCVDDVCIFTLTVDPFSGPTGYYKFKECGDVANPTIGLMQGKTYLFDQGITSNWYHPLGFAYLPDGAHDGVDELEPGIRPPGSSVPCDADFSCQAPVLQERGVRRRG
jgi:hypothetical protein